MSADWFARLRKDDDMEEVPTLPRSADQNTGEKKESKTLGSVAAVLGAGIGFVVAQALPFEVTIRLAAGALAGFLCGLIPSFIAKQRNNLKFGKLALGICTLSGSLLGLLLAIPLCITFTIVALATKPKTTTPLQEPPDLPKG